jgi:magnesium-protoporphyrin IX monomethyl ester (oxidative) cyclase
MKKGIKKIMLLYPPVTRPSDFSAKIVRVSVFFPLGLAYLAAVLEETRQYELNILDALIEGDIKEGAPLKGGEWIRYGLTDDAISKMIKAFTPDVLLVSCLFSAMQMDAANVCRIAKETDPDIVTVVGGAHAGGMAPEFINQHRDVDFVVQGEGEVTLLDLLNQLKGGQDFSGLDGIAYRENGSSRYIPKSKYIEQLDEIAFPARHLFAMEKYFASASSHSTFRDSPFTQIITSRGCPCKCTFCALGNHWGNRQRMRSAANVLDEIEVLVSHYGVREIHFEDDNLTADKKRAMDIFDGMIERGFDISWNVPSGMAVYTLDEELIEKMKESGCYSVSLAIESGNQQVLHKLMNKPVNLKTVPHLAKKIREVGMDARGFFIIGYPDETRETIRQTIDFARELELDWSYFFIASPLPNTKMYRTCIEKGYIKEGDFDPIRSFHKSIIRTPEFTPEYLADVREEAIVDVNFKNNPNLRKYDIDKAIRSFQEVLGHYPHFDFANFYLGEAYLKKGELEKAVASYRDTLKANPSHVQARERLEEFGQKQF